MYARLKKIASGISAIAGAAIVVAGLGSAEALAQRFEHTYGGFLCNEAGRGGVQPVRSGGYVAAGESFSPSQCTSADIYVVRTHNDGSRAWAVTYDLGGNDSATDIQEVLNDPGGNDGFIITGVSDNRFNGRCWNGRDLFLLRIDGCGRVMWASTYGRESSDEIGWDVVEARTGNPSAGTNPGDFIVAGSTTFGSECRNRNGYLIRTDSRGQLIWDAYYDGPNRRDDYFYGLDECLFNINNLTGDIVVVGGSNSYSTRSYDAWIVRVDGDNGGFNAPLHQAAAYGDRGLEELRSVQELRYSCRHEGDLIATGRTGSNLRSTDAYVLETTADPCRPVTDVTLGDQGTQPDEGYCVREIWFDDNGLRSGDIVITGYLTTPAYNRNGSKDAFLQTYLPGTLNSLAPVTVVYGGDRNDWGWSVSPVEGDRCRTSGFVVAGFTNSTNLIQPFDPQQLYLFKTDGSRSDGCTSQVIASNETRPGFQPQCELPALERFTEQCRVEVLVECQYEWSRICITMDGLPFCQVDGCFCP